MFSSSKFTKVEGKQGVVTPEAFGSNVYGVNDCAKPAFNQQLSSDCSSLNANVKFSGLFKEKNDDREKYLTAKYPNHQMALIKKRLKVEFWIDDKLKLLFQVKDENIKDDYEICPDDLVDTLLDIETDEDRTIEIFVR